jgi:hypothetical protein
LKVSVDVALHRTSAVRADTVIGLDLTMPENNALGDFAASLEWIKWYFEASHLEFEIAVVKFRITQSCKLWFTYGAEGDCTLLCSGHK